jgi:ABC-type Fe3+ transport system permease subunit
MHSGYKLKSSIIVLMIRTVFMNTKILAAVVVMAATIGLVVVEPQLALAQSTDEACDAIGGCSGGESDLQRIIELVVNIFSVIIGIVAVIMIMYGGFKYITSGGDSSQTASAKNTVIYAIIGLVIVALAQFLVHFVLANVISDE